MGGERSRDHRDIAKGDSVDLETIPQQARERIEKISKADLLVGVLADHANDAPAMVRQALAGFNETPRTVVFQGDHVAASPNGADAGSVDSGAAQEEGVFVVPWTLLSPDASVSPVQSMANAYQFILAAGDKLGVQACCIVGSDLQTVTSEWISRLVQPILQGGFDLVTPCYAHGKFEGLLNSSLISPLNRALYGTRLQNPLGPDLSMSRSMFQRMLGAEQGNKPAGSQTRTLASLAPTAICGGFKICQAYLGPRTFPPTDWTNLSSLLVQVLGPIFLDVERNATCWQRARPPVSPPIVGERMMMAEDKGAVDVRRMLELFQLGARDLPEIWGLVLPPTSLIELRKLSRLQPDQFRMPDDLWVHIVYDFALGYRLRTISRDHLLRAMTPLYLGWVASHSLEMENAPARAVEQRLERLCHVFEANRSYLVSRWRWPDRFNP